MVPAISDRDFILQQVVRILVESADSGNDSNLLLQLALTELVKQMMRSLAQASEADHRQGNLLQAAMQTTTQLLEARAETAIQCDMSPYFERIYCSLRWVAKEMTALGLRLRQARQSEVMRAPRVVSAAPVPFQITELGTRGTPEGLIAHPLTASRLNLEAIQQLYRVRGMGYPWEVEVGGITFVVEVDGSIVTFLIGLCISQVTQGNIAEFARRLGLLKSAVWQWQSGKAIPQLSVLLKICQTLGLSLPEFFFCTEILDTKNPSLKTIQDSSQASQHSPVKFDLSKVQQDLEDALLEEPPLSMEAVAKRVKISSRSLRRRFPKLCSAISSRYLSQREKIRLAKVEQYCIEVRQIALELYNEGIDPTRSYISRYLSKPAYFREPLVDAALMAVRKELGLEKS